MAVTESPVLCAEQTPGSVALNIKGQILSQCWLLMSQAPVF